MFVFRSGIRFSFQAFGSARIESEKRVILRHFPHSRFVHFQCPKRKSKTTSEYKHTRFSQNPLKSNQNEKKTKMEYRLKQKMQIRAKIQIVTKCDQIVLTTAWGAGNIFHLLCLWFCVSHPGAIFNLLNASGVGRVMSPLHYHPSPLFEALRKCYITSCRKYRIKTGKCSNFEAQWDIFCDLKRIFKNDCSSWTKWMTLTSLYFIHSWDELWDL